MPMSLHYRRRNQEHMQERLETDMVTQLTTMKHKLESDCTIPKSLQLRISRALTPDARFFDRIDFKPSMLGENFECLVMGLERQYNVDRRNVHRMHQHDEGRRHAFCGTLPEPPLPDYHPDLDVHTLAPTAFSSLGGRCLVQRMDATRALVDELTSMNRRGLLSRCYETQTEIHELNVLIAGMRPRADASSYLV